MKQLLERWAQLEPDICEDLYGQTIRLHMLDDSTYSIHPVIDELPLKELAMIQWAVQQAIIEKGWYFLIRYNNGLCMVETGSVIPSPRYTKDDAEITEVLLSAYLAELEASANP